MTKEECIKEGLAAVLPDTDECLIREHTLTVKTGGASRTITCTGSHLDELVQGFCLTEGQERKEKIKPVEWSPGQIYGLAEAFLGYEGLHKCTSASHMAILAMGDEIITVMEDISRHCAIDKVIGYGMLNGTDLSKCMIFTSGRVQYDTVRKLVNAGVPILVSKSVPTMEAAGLAKDRGITLIGRAWPDRYTVFT